MIVVLVDPRRPTLVPVEAIEFLRGEVQYTEEMPGRGALVATSGSFGARRKRRAGVAVV